MTFVSFVVHSQGVEDLSVKSQPQLEYLDLKRF